jgi:hypothetical protein
MENEQEKAKRYCYLCANSRKSEHHVMQSILTGWPVRLMCPRTRGPEGAREGRTAHSLVPGARYLP